MSDKSATTSPSWPISIGPPVWGSDHWAGKVYPAGTAKKDYLSWYSRTFNIVEGNSTFYGLPGPATFEKWAAETADGFEFSLKFPRAISHDAMLENCRIDLELFLDRLQILSDAKRLGPTFLQLGPSFAADRFSVLERFLNRLPDRFPWAVEVRHFDWFDHGRNEERLDELLRTLQIDKVLFDSRALFQSDPEDEIEVASQAKKPRTPHRQTVTATRPMIRMVGRNRVELAETYIDDWAPTIADWIGRGLRPIIFTHAPDDAVAPDFARLWMSRLRAHLSGHELTVPSPPAALVQPSLFAI